MMTLSPELEEKYRNDPRSNGELIDLVLRKDMDADDEAFWDPMRLLQYRLPAIIDDVVELLKSKSDMARDSAATILGQSRMPVKWNGPRCVDLLLASLADETAIEPLVSALHAVGHFHEKRCIPAILRFQEHANADVRYAATVALGGFENEEAIMALIKLSADPDFDVRNWATFNLGSLIDADTPAIREALAARLTETDGEIKGEAIVGLSRRGDARSVRPMLELLDRISQNEVGSETFNVSIGTRDWTFMEDAVAEVINTVMRTSDVRWKPVLLQARLLKIGDPKKIRLALERCASLQ